MKIITVSSFKGGTAKTSVCLHFGAALAKFHKKKVLLIDLDSQANLTYGLGFDPDEQDSMAPVLQKEKKIEDIILKTDLKNLFLAPADAWLERTEVTGSLASDRYSHERLKDIISQLPYDYILIDTPPSLCWLTESSLIASSQTLICATPEFYSVKGLQKLSEFIKNISKRHSLEVLGIALSFWHPRGKNNQEFHNVIEETFPEKLLQTKIRRDIAISEAAIHGRSVFETAKKSRAYKDYRNLAKEILLRM